MNKVQNAFNNGFQKKAEELKKEGFDLGSITNPVLNYFQDPENYRAILNSGLIGGGAGVLGGLASGGGMQGALTGGLEGAVTGAIGGGLLNAASRNGYLGEGGTVSTLLNKGMGSAIDKGLNQAGAGMRNVVTFPLRGAWNMAKGVIGYPSTPLNENFNARTTGQ